MLSLAAPSAQIWLQLRKPSDRRRALIQDAERARPCAPAVLARQHERGSDELPECRIQVAAGHGNRQGLRHLLRVRMLPHVAADCEPESPRLRGCHDVRENLALGGALWPTKDHNRHRRTGDDLTESLRVAAILRACGRMFEPERDIRGGGPSSDAQSDTRPSCSGISATGPQSDRLLMPRREGLGQANPGPRSDMRERPALIHLSLRPFAPRALPAQQNGAPMFASRLAPRLESNPSGGVPPRKPMRFMTAIGHAGRCSTSDHFGGPTDRVLVPHGSHVHSEEYP